jgi:DNA-binding ferritin-like protein
MPPLRATRITLPEMTRARSVALLQQGPAHALDLERLAKQTHWKARGSSFSALHALFDQVAEEAVVYSDLCAEGLVALGGTADGSVAPARTPTGSFGSTCPRAQTSASSARPGSMASPTA